MGLMFGESSTLHSLYVGEGNEGRRREVRVKKGLTRTGRAGRHVLETRNQDRERISGKKTRRSRSKRGRWRRKRGRGL